MESFGFETEKKKKLKNGWNWTESKRFHRRRGHAIWRWFLFRSGTRRKWWSHQCVCKHNSFCILWLCVDLICQKRDLLCYSPCESEKKRAASSEIRRTDTKHTWRKSALTRREELVFLHSCRNQISLAFDNNQKKLLYLAISNRIKSDLGKPSFKKIKILWKIP